MDLICSFDDTGSMSSIRHEVRRKIQDLTDTLFKVIPELRIGIVIHNDYGDRDCYHQFPLSSSQADIIAALNKQITPGGYGQQAAYELSLRNFHATFNWKSDKRVAILIGDEVPNKVGMIRGIHNNTFDWRTETESCKKAGIKIYGIHALGSARTRPFYETISRVTGGIKLDLSQFSHMPAYITAVAYSNAESSDKLDEFESSDPIYKSNMALKNMFAKLRGSDVSLSDDKLTMLSRFQVLDVFDKTKITDFVRSQGLTFKKGKGFYQLVKSEKVQDYKEIVAVHKYTGEALNQDQSKKLLGLPDPSGYKTITTTVNPSRIYAARDYDIYIQSTSYTRLLDPNTKFLYELDHC